MQLNNNKKLDYKIVDVLVPFSWDAIADYIFVNVSPAHHESFYN